LLSSQDIHLHLSLYSARSLYAEGLIMHLYSFTDIRNCKPTLKKYSHPFWKKPENRQYPSLPFISIPNNVRVFQNQRSSEKWGFLWVGIFWFYLGEGVWFLREWGFFIVLFSQIEGHISDYHVSCYITLLSI